ncbi:laccase domain protein YfiH [Clostridium homopropionicum DSM 5847]|uniref:Purine nucleoside phosphorylase n=1 Tax=Clostridium homopropionicum DSM 5847 TaxID=1121318 RepID=A0A0L6ZC20_9CLOT|nr:peptidoglycan editing factor PgeF [Clostridium homopropionicum]KOA20502.1 laccase domain protein YfiH [Clostridium homopropionicum DSM 5847]SFG36971.1 conserved hypothetical protein [Clostridium homopropionicum]
MIESNLIIVDDIYKFMKFQDNEAEIYFSSAEGGLNFNPNNNKGIENINKLKEWFELKDVGYLKQIHSDIVHIYDGKIIQGDAIMTNKRGVAVGVFTADCVPIIIYDKVNKAVSAIHSGWKGTLGCIVLKSIEEMKKTYESKLKDLSIYIGPHNMGCCYEVGVDLIEKFLESNEFSKEKIIYKRNLSLQNCIINQLNSIGIGLNQINLVNKCTSCNNEFELYSYRKSSNKEGRMFSFIFLR